MKTSRWQLTSRFTRCLTSSLPPAGFQDKKPAFCPASPPVWRSLKLVDGRKGCSRHDREVHIQAGLNGLKASPGGERYAFYIAFAEFVPSRRACAARRNSVQGRCPAFAQREL